MISVGIDVSKEKSTICAMKPYGEIIMSPKDFKHTKEDMEHLTDKISSLGEDVKCVLEATGKYHLPICQYLKSHHLFVSVINPLEMKRYRCQGLRNAKTDKIDSKIIAQYGIDHWYQLSEPQEIEQDRYELRLLGRQYAQTMKIRVKRCQALSDLLDMTMPGICGLLNDFNRYNGKDKLCDFVREYWHYDNITKSSEKVFIKKYQTWSKKNGYRRNEDEARQLYALAMNSILTLDCGSEPVRLMIQNSVDILKEVDASLYTILNQMRELAKTMPEYDTVLSMGGIGETLAPCLIAEIGDIRQYHSGSALVAYAGIDVPPYESGKFVGTKRHISKRGSPLLRLLGYQIIDCLNKHGPRMVNDTSVYNYFMKKRAEGKPYKVAGMAAFNKFLRIYHSRVTTITTN